MGPHPSDGAWHAIAPGDLRASETCGYAEALCGAQLLHAGLEHAALPGDMACLPGLIGTTADLRVLAWVDIVP
jgi:hypothetical protein